jgi:hypothetical protein
MYASAEAMYCSHENSSVTLIGTRQKLTARSRNAFACARYLDEKIRALPLRVELHCLLYGARVSFASNGDTSIDTRPSTWTVVTSIGANGR